MAPTLALVLFLGLVAMTMVNGADPGPGSWELVVGNGGVSAMHMTTTHKGTVIMYDRTNYGPSEILLDRGRCRDNPNDQALTHDCWAHSIEYTISDSTIRPLMVMTDTWCSSGAFSPDGTLVNTGGFHDGGSALRHFVPCGENELCDWVDNQPNALLQKRWYAANQALPDGRVIVIGGLDTATVEFVPRRSSEGLVSLPFLSQNSLYPLVHLSTDGNLFVMVNSDSILWNYKSNTVVKTFPSIPDGPRIYPFSASSTMLPLMSSDGFNRAEVLVCGGAPGGAINTTAALKSCGRMVITDANAKWDMEDMPFPRAMGDMLILPNAEILIINGAKKGLAGWGMASDPALEPLVYRPNEEIGKRFTVLGGSTIARMYHSTANVLPNGRVLVGGSNTHFGYERTGVEFPTELRLEEYKPYYLDASLSAPRPKIDSLSASSVKYGETFVVKLSLGMGSDDVKFNLYAPPFTTHAVSMNQRMLVLSSNGSLGTYAVAAPPNNVVAPPGYFMLFAVNSNVPSNAAWILIS